MIDGDQRRAERFGMDLPVKVVRIGAEFVMAVGKTRDMSSQGVLFVIDRELVLGEKIEFVVTFFGQDDPGRALDLHCTGQVVRVESEAAPDRHLLRIAATIEQFRFLFRREASAAATKPGPQFFGGS